MGMEFSRASTFVTRFGAYLELRRIKAGLSRDDMAILAGVSYDDLLRFELGEGDPMVSQIDRIARALETTGAKLVRACELWMASFGG